MSEPKSVRLTIAHRKDITEAVMSEWTKQNPPPVHTSQEVVLIAIAEELKKHPAYKRTQKALEHFNLSERNHFQLEAGINVRVNDKHDSEKRTFRTGIPVSFAEKYGLKGIGHQNTQTIYDFDKLTEADNPNCDNYANCIAFVERNYPSVILQEDHPALIESEEVRKEQHTWQKEHDKLKEETADLLNQYNTTKQLRETWPEIVNYLPPHIADPERAVTLPVLATSRLSERLGIK